jgi:hypothetical protein
MDVVCSSNGAKRGAYRIVLLTARNVVVWENEHGEGRQ